MTPYASTCHYTGARCPTCDAPIATDGRGAWCVEVPAHTLPVPPQCPHGVVGGAGCEDCAHDDDGAGLARGGAS